MGKNDSKTEQSQKSLTNNDESILSVSGGSTVYDLSQIDGNASLTVNGYSGSDVLNIFKALASPFTAVIGGIQDQFKSQTDSINNIATTATGTQTEMERLINKLIVPGFLLVGGLALMNFWSRKK
tara:strand:+ start:10 stop:384 length:375 start_codon:yes stop_codon:yes gene_type:complete